MTTLTKRDLASKVAESTGCKKATALEAVDALFETMRESLIDGDRIEIRGFGVLLTKATKPKPAARNPRTGEIVYVPARRKTHFKPGRLLRQGLHEVIPKAEE